MKLFKYYRVSVNSISCLTNDHVWFSSPKDFNDPFDTAIFDGDFLNEKYFSKEKIFCLSAKNDDLLMWGHYADSHKGFCVEFSPFTDAEIEGLKDVGIFPKVDNSLLTLIQYAKKVEYKTQAELNEFVKDIPLEDPAYSEYNNRQIALGNEDIGGKLFDSLLMKHIDWKYEEEYRLIARTKHLVFLPGKITGIYFGMNMPPIDKKTILTTMETNANGKLCTFYQMYRPLGEFSLKYRPLDYDKDIFKKMGTII